LPKPPRSPPSGSSSLDELGEEVEQIGIVGGWQIHDGKVNFQVGERGEPGSDAA
jgi:hypothetical protein